MINNQTNMNFRTPVIDVTATSKNLKSLREGRGISVSEIQNMFGMENPQSIYNWENPERKTLPCIDNLVLLAKIYKVTLDELIVIKEDDSAELRYAKFKEKQFQKRYNQLEKMEEQLDDLEHELSILVLSAEMHK